MKKCCSAVAMFLFFCCFIASCDSFTYKSTETSTNSLWNMSYEKFDGRKSKCITLNNTCTLNFQITSYEGSLSVIIQDEDEDENIIYESDDITTSSFEVPINNSGKYELILEAKKHNGNFNISW